MAKENETIADIIAEMRGDGHTGPADALEWVRIKLEHYADRLEAAYKRERGDCAKLREAVCEILSYIESFHKYITPGKGKKLTALFAVADTIRNNARAALAATPRNCDVYNSESCRLAYHLHGDGLMTMQAFADWLYAPATEKEGGAK